MLIIFSGLPGVGKTTIARELARRLAAVYLRLDSLEQALVDSGSVIVENLGPGGYYAGAAVAVDNLRNGLSVIGDCVNPWPETRDLWRMAARRADTDRLEVEVVCSDTALHRRRAEKRVSDIPGLVLPEWRQILARGYVPWDEADMRLDSAVLSPAQAVEAIVSRISQRIDNSDSPRPRHKTQP